MKSKYLILGGAGFIGSNLTKRLVSLGHTVKVYSRSSRSISNLLPIMDDIDLVYGDLMDHVTLKNALENVETVIHLISTTFPGTTLNSGVYDINSNLVPTVKLLEMCTSCNVKNLIYASSGGTVYGEPQTIPVSEDHPLNPLSIYGQSKKAIEGYLEFFSRVNDLNIQILRISNPFGPFQNPFAAQGVIAVAMGCVLFNRPFKVFGDGSTVRDYIYIDDVIDAFLAAANNNSSNVCNISFGHGTSVTEILECIEKYSSKKIKKIYIDARQGDVKVNILSNNKASETYGWSPKIDFSTGISKTWDWLSTSNLCN